MTMKKHLIYIIGIVSLLFIACEETSEGQRILDVAEIKTRRTVLLEDYTGQACVNCPNAHKEALSLYNSSAYHDNLIVVAIHAGMQAVPSPAGLKQPEGDEYADKFGVKEYPNGMINRRGGLKNYPSWGAAVYEELQRESKLNLSVEASVANGKLDVRADLLALEALEGKLQLWITEDSIISFQTSSEGSIPQYVHNHVFRGAINGTWGEELSFVSGEQKQISHTDFEINTMWKSENLHIVAFMYNSDGVLQASQCKVNVNE